MKEVTLCIPVYNAEKTLARTLESLLAQDYPISKIKIFDNLSTDNSQKISQEFAEKHPSVELHVNEKNLGAEGNFTRCIMATEGDYSALVHSDDIYEKDFISKSIEFLDSRPDCIATFCGALEVDANENVIGERFLPPEIEKKAVTVLTRNDLMKLVFKYSNFITCPSVIVRSSIYREKIKYWSGEKFKTSADLDVWLRLSEFGNIAAIKKPLMKYRVADASYSYRVAKKRTTRHDLFLVLDCYKNESNISDYNFLALKDQSIRSLNIIRNQKREICFPNEVKFDLVLVVKKMGQSKWHFKMGLAIIAIKALVSGLTLVGWNRGCKR